jgi:hypothetical protein
MEHIFYLSNQYPLSLIRRIISVFHISQVMMKKTNTIFFNNTCPIMVFEGITKFNLTSFFLLLPKAHFRPNLISIIPCSKGPNLPFFPPILPQKRITSHRLFQKDCAQFRPCPSVHFPVLSTKTQKKRFESHFILKIPDLRGQKSTVPGLPAPSRCIAISLVSGFCSLIAVLCSLIPVLLLLS